MNFPHYHEDMTHLHVGTLPSRAYFIPHGERDAAMKGLRTASTRMTLLSGTWRFGYYASLLDLPEDLFSPDATPDEIPVPSVWQCQGYDAHQYVNARFPIPYDPPYVPVENPCGLYARTFHWSATEGESATLHFEGVDSCFYVWVNEQFVGYSQVAHSTSAFDVTSFLLNGENHIAVLVLKWCDGTYFEDQDKFRQSGIFRDVYILRRSACHLPDAEVARIKREIPLLEDDRQRLYMGLLVYTGMRREEVLGLGWENIHLAEGYGEVHRVVTYPDNTRTVVKNEPKTATSERTFIIPAPLKRLLLPFERESGYVIHGDTPGCPASYSTAQRTYRAAFKQSGILGKFNNHDWRSTFGTQLKERGISSAIVADLLGHADTRMVETTYARTRHEGILKQRETVEALSTFL